MTMSRSTKSARPRRPCRSALKVVSLGQPRSAPGASSSVGSGRHCTSLRTPWASSVRQTKRKSPLRWRRTMPYRRFTYCGPYLVPHFMHSTMRSPAASFTATPCAAADRCPSPGNPGIARSSGVPRSRRRRSGSAAAAWPRQRPPPCSRAGVASSQVATGSSSTLAAAPSTRWRCRWSSTSWWRSACEPSSSSRACSRSRSGSAM